jgi:hypothetical protein
MTLSVLELLNSWGPTIGCGHAKEAWRLAPLCLLCCIWRERNMRLAGAQYVIYLDSVPS